MIQEWAEIWVEKIGLALVVVVTVGPACPSPLPPLPSSKSTESKQVSVILVDWMFCRASDPRRDRLSNNDRFEKMAVVIK